MNLQAGRAPEKFAVMRDVALEAGDADGVREAERGAELWWRSPEEWEWERAAKLQRLENFRNALVETYAQRAFVDAALYGTGVIEFQWDESISTRAPGWSTQITAGD